jgi:predicted small lipoprotein YifL
MRLILMAMLVAGVTVAACGKKGDPIRPGTEKLEEKDG